MKNILANKDIKNLIETKKIPIIIDAKTKIMSAHFLLDLNDKSISNERITMNPYFYNRFHLQGQLMAFFHEYMHFYLAYNKNPFDHTTLRNSPEYSQGIREIFPGKDESFYNYMRWAGCTDTPEFLGLDDFEQVFINSWLGLNLEQK